MKMTAVFQIKYVELVPGKTTAAQGDVTWQ